MIRLLIGVVTLTLGLSVNAQEWPGVDIKAPKNVPNVLKKAEEDGAQIRYLGEYEDFYGWIIFNQGLPSFTYTSKDESVAFQGTLFDKNGNNITLQQVQKFRLSNAGDSFDTLNAITQLAEDRQKQAVREEVSSRINDRLQNQSEALNDSEVEGVNNVQERPQPTKADRLLIDLEKSNWIGFGDQSKPYIYAMIDPLCGHCRDAMLALRPYIDRGVMQVRVVPVGFNPRSLRVGALLLASRDPKKVYYDFVSGKSDDLGEDEAINTQGVERNVFTINTWGFDATPMMFYRNASGEVKIIRGTPKDYELIVKDLNG